jgi:hypothetical protein
LACVFINYKRLIISNIKLTPQDKSYKQIALFGFTLIEFNRQQPTAQSNLFFDVFLELNLGKQFFDAFFNVAVVLLSQFAHQFAEVVSLHLFKKMRQHYLQESTVDCADVRKVRIEFENGQTAVGKGITDEFGKKLG